MMDVGAVFIRTVVTPITPGGDIGDQVSAGAWKARARREIASLVKLYCCLQPDALVAFETKRTLTHQSTACLLDDDLRSDAYTLVEVLDVFVEHPDTAVRNKTPD
jgi:hypothetical protein